MITEALLFCFESQADEDTMDIFQEDLATEVSWEKATRAWFSIRYMRGEFGTYACFDDEEGLQAHLAGTAVAALNGAEHRLMLRFNASPGKAAEAARMMSDCPPLVDKEPGTLAWFANRYDDTHFGTFAVFADNGARFAHLTGQIPRTLGMTGLSLLDGAPEVYMVDVMTGTARQAG